MAELEKYSNLSKYLDTQDSRKTLEGLLGALDHEVAQKTVRSNLESRKSDWQKAIEKFDVEKLVELQEKMENYVDEIAVRELPETPVVLDEKQRYGLMKEHIDLTTIKEVLEARRDFIKAAVFQSLTQENIEAGIEDPENQNGKIEVPELKKVFCREGTGRSNPSINEEKLEELLGEEIWEKVVDRVNVPEVVIPAHTETNLNVDKLMAVATEDPQLLEKLRESLVPGKYKSPKFMVRDLKG